MKSALVGTESRVTFKSFDSEDSLQKATEIVRDHMRWFKAFVAYTFKGIPQDELACDEPYQMYMREPEIILAVVANLTAEEIVTACKRKAFDHYITTMAGKLGHKGFCSIVDSYEMRIQEIIDEYNAVVSSENVEQDVITVETRSERFKIAHMLTKTNIKLIGNYAVGLSYYLRMIVVVKPDRQFVNKLDVLHPTNIEIPTFEPVDDELFLEALVGKSVEIEFGTKKDVLSVEGLKEWEGGNNKRIYIQLDCKKCTPIHSLYMIVDGTTRDDVLEVAGRKFGFVYGNCNSGSKRDEARRALRALLSNLE